MRPSSPLRRLPLAIALSLAFPAAWSQTAACQYGSRAAFAMIDARHAYPIDTSSPELVVSPL